MPALTVMPHPPADRTPTGLPVDLALVAQTLRGQAALLEVLATLDPASSSLAAMNALSEARDAADHAVRRIAEQARQDGALGRELDTKTIAQVTRRRRPARV